MLLFQFPGVHIGQNVAVGSGGSGQVQHKGRVEIVQHFHAQIGPGVMALVHHHNGGQLTQHLNQRGVRRVSQQDGGILNIPGKLQQVSIFLIDLAGLLFCTVNAQGVIAQDADGQLSSHGLRGKELSVEQHFLGIDAHPPGKVRIKPKAVFMIRV